MVIYKYYQVILISKTHRSAPRRTDSITSTLTDFSNTVSYSSLNKPAEQSQKVAGVNSFVAREQTQSSLLSDVIFTIPSF